MGVLSSWQHTWLHILAEGLYILAAGLGQDHKMREGCRRCAAGEKEATCASRRHCKQNQTRQEWSKRHALARKTVGEKDFAIAEQQGTSKSHNF
eukprot:1146939-Pelagomonas_calceolata.AAC.6